ncbi:hypothetical protein [Pseudomonas chlororaphis]|uniref:hypothetical protein n=1 Tax=Pseudomonas chlororaphis TaxID=587753 RepID=UPI0014758A5D|nr:hypothetical protein [Pseudomonas chlororaphis]NNB41716.1 hypothetical protein [Pseudomonas chlororaphis]
MHKNRSTCSWVYSLREEASTRLPVLTAGTTFAEITQRIISEMSVLCCHYSEIVGTGFSRPVYTVQIGKELFDLFFNSPDGYRAAYFRSPGDGLNANISFIRAILLPLEESPLSANSKLCSSRIHQCLVTPSAKVWLAEHGKEIDSKCPGCTGEWSSGTAGRPDQAEIHNGVWEAASGQNAEWGRKAPYLTKLRVMGAFLNDQYHEYVPQDKRFRAYGIHRDGWS